MARRAREIKLSMRVWDAPIRLFHWIVVLLIATSYASVHEGWMQIHFISGYCMLTLLLFRLAWGFVGSETARFARFLGSPIAALQHLARLHRREPDTEIGHNSAGGWMVLVMLLLLCVQAGTGLFSNDQVLSEGPLAKYVGQAVSDRISSIHAFNFNLILAAIVLHLAAITIYAVVKGQNLVTPMITGRKRLPAMTRQPRLANPLLALLLLAVAASLVWVLANYV
jgi:cytochrome b